MIKEKMLQALRLYTHTHTHTHTLYLLNKEIKKLNMRYSRSKTVSIFDTS